MKKLLFFLLCASQCAFAQVTLVSSGNGTCSSPNGYVVISVSGGTAPYTVNISNSACSVNTNTTFGASTFTVSGVAPCASGYTFTVYDNASNNMGSVTATIANPNITATVSTQAASCSGACNGSVTVTVTGGTPPYNYNWSNMYATPQVTNLCAGTYTVTVADNYGCSTVAVANIGSPPALTTSFNTISPSCNGICNGSITVNASGGTPVYQYLWSNGVTTQQVGGLCAGSYTCTVTDSHSCTVTHTINLVQPAAVTASIIATNPSCAMLCNGSMTATAAGGTAPYAWTWIPASGNGGILTGLCAGNYTLIATDPNGCTGLAVASLTAGSLAISVSPNQATVCAGSSMSFTALGAMTYTWSNGSTGSVLTAIAPSSTVYTVTGSDMSGCTGTQTASIAVDNTCAIVWPGDANSDGSADNTDLLELGLHMGLTGPARASQGNTWTSYLATSWTGNTSTGSNLVHSDCNGDGIIDQNDTLAVYNNYGQTHAFKNSGTATTGDVTITPNQSTLVPGAWGSAAILLGNASNQQMLHGLAFTVQYDNALLEQDSVYIQYVSSFMDPLGHNLRFRKRDFANNALYCASTQTTLANATGNGQIATLYYKLKQTLSSNAVLTLGISGVTKMMANGTSAPLTSGTGTVNVAPIATGIQDYGQAALMMYPNPASTRLTVSSPAIISTIELYDMTGRLQLKDKSSGSRQFTVDVSGLAGGVYYLSAYGEQGLLKTTRISIVR